MFVDKKELFAKLTMLATTVNRKSALAVTTCVAIREKEFSTTNLSTQATINVECEDATVVAAISFDKLFNIVKRLPDGEVSLRQNGDKVSIRSGRSMFTLGTLPYDDFPKLQFAETQDSLSIPSSSLLDAMKRVAFAMGKNDARQHLNGMIFDLSIDHIPHGEQLRDGQPRLRLAATNGHRLATADIELSMPCNARKFIVPNESIMALIRLLPDDDRPVQIDVTEDSIICNVDEFQYAARLLMGTPVDYQRVIPKDIPYSATIDRLEFIQALRRCLILADDKYKGVSLLFDNNQLALEAKNGNETSLETLPIEHEGEVRIGFNISYLLDMLSSMQGNKIKFACTDGNSPGLFGDDSNSDYILMPMRI